MDDWTVDQYIPTNNTGSYYNYYKNDPAVVHKFEDRFMAEQQRIPNYLPCRCRMCTQEISKYHNKIYPTTTIIPQSYNLATTLPIARGVEHFDDQINNEQILLLFMFIIIVISCMILKCVQDIRRHNILTSKPT